MQNHARFEAQKLWNTLACGELDGDKENAKYFDQVEKDRYHQNAWALKYFGYHRFSTKKVLEIGVGQGTDLMQFAKAGAVCYGVDITDNHLTLTHKNFELRGKHVKLNKADATQLPFSDNYFDCVYSFGVLHHIPEIEIAISEAHRVLKPGGELMIAVYNKWSAFHIFCKLIANGLRNGWLFSKGYQGLLATIEKGADGVHIKPYVKLFSKNDLRNLMVDFSIEDISAHLLEPGHFWPAQLAKYVRRWVPMLEPYLGWYVTCVARKV